jgi:hypothetical protein
MEDLAKTLQEAHMTIAPELLRRHVQTLIDDNAQWQTLIADDMTWDIPYAPSLGFPARLSGREQVVGHAAWLLGAMENFHFYDLKVHPFADPEGPSPRSRRRAFSRRRGGSYARTSCPS